MSKVTVTSRVSEVLRATDDQGEDALRECGAVIKRKARENCPVDTGALRDSIDFEVEDNVLTVGSDLDYALPVELGTRNQRAQPFLSKAFEDTSLFQKIIESALGG